jgi:hypothetical protein
LVYDNDNDNNNDNDNGGGPFSARVASRQGLLPFVRATLATYSTAEMARTLFEPVDYAADRNVSLTKEGRRDSLLVRETIIAAFSLVRQQQNPQSPFLTTGYPALFTRAS